MVDMHNAYSSAFATKYINKMSIIAVNHKYIIFPFLRQIHTRFINHFEFQRLTLSFVMQANLFLLYLGEYFEQGSSYLTIFHSVFFSTTP